jgi:trehalose/maltose hydrolase-like predicted phosphorylase
MRTTNVPTHLAPRGTRMSAAAPPETDLPRAVARRFEAVIFDWDGTAVPGRHSDASEVRGLVELLCGAGVDVAVVSGTHVDNVDGQLLARPKGPGRLLLALNRGSELFEVDQLGPRLLARREATPQEDAALTRAARDTVEKLATRGFEARIVSQRLNRRKIDLLPEPEWADPPKSEIDRVVAAAEQRLRAAGIDGLVEAAQIALAAARDAGCVDAKVTSDAKHVEIGLTDKSDSARAVLAELWADGIPADQVLIGGDEFGPLGGLVGSDSMMLVAEAEHATAFSVGVEPEGLPDRVVSLPGGPPTFVVLLADQLARRDDVPVASTDPAWSLVVDGFDTVRERADESLLAISDGLIGTTAAPLLSHSDTRPKVMAAGMYDGVGAGTALLAAPRWAALEGSLQPQDRIRRALDLHTGVLTEHVDGTTTLDSARFASVARPGVACLRATVDPVDASPPLAKPLTKPLDASEPECHDGPDWMATCGTGGSITAAASQPRDGAHFDRLVAYVTGSDEPRPEDAKSNLAEASRIGFDGLLVEHRREWSRRWAGADIVIRGDDELQHAVRVALFHLMASVGSRGEAAVGARGLSGDGYRGHVFWDADVFVLPFFAATHPSAARAMLEYRIRRLPKALARARSEQLLGARFPWESATTGDDVTPRSVVDIHGARVPIRTGTDELHIVGDVAWAAWCYGAWTGDDAFTRGPGHRLLVETARYWASRVRVDNSGIAHLFGVIGPDEYHEPVDDDAYTNVLARWNLRAAAESVERCGNSGLEAGEQARWLDLAGALTDGYHADTGIYEEFAGFFDLDPLRIADIAARPVTADLLLGRDRVRKSQIVKQADVLMLHHLLPDEVVPGSLEANLDFYESRTAHGSSLSPGIHAALFARAGRMTEAVDLLRIAARIDLDDVGQTGAGGVHLGAMGSVWQAFAFGFTGARPHGDALALDPKLPPAWSELEQRLQFRGTSLRVRIRNDHLNIVASAPIDIELDGRRAHCPEGETTFPIETR